MIAIICWILLFIFLIVFMCSIMPWWLVLLMIVVFFLYAIIPWNQPYINRSRAKRYKKRSVQQKKAEPKNNIPKTTNNPRINRTNANIGAGTYSQKDDNFDYERYRAIREEQAAYDDFIASMDMADD